MKFDSTKIINAFFLSCAAAGITYLGFTKYYEKELRFGENYPELIEVNDDVEKNFYKSVDKESMQYDMIEGLIEGLDDRFTLYKSMKETDLDYVNNSVMLKSNGIQIGIDGREKCIVVTEVVPDSVAESKGIAVGDRIISIDDIIVQKNGSYNSIELLLGSNKKPLELVCDHEGKRYNVSLKMGVKPVEKDNVVENKLYDNGILYYNLKHFDVNTIPDFEKEIKQHGNDITGLVLDVRNNAGGETEVAVKFFDKFYGSGCQVKLVYEKSGEEIFFKTTEGKKYDYPVILLTSKNTLSAAEILTVFFQNTNRGIAVGNVTGGKGCFQRIVTLDDFSKYKLVSGYYYVNDLPNYDGVGVTPDVVVDMDPELIGTDDDIQLKKALELLS